jgi:hypothetical protein
MLTKQAPQEAVAKRLPLGDAETRDLFEMGLDLSDAKTDNRATALARRFLRDPKKFRGDVAAAFLLGAWVAEQVEVIPTVAGRKTGQVRATEARRKQGKARRQAIIEAACKLYAEDRSLKHQH